MTPQEYENLQLELYKLINNQKYNSMTGKRKEGYEQGVLACKSLIHSFYVRKYKESDNK